MFEQRFTRRAASVVEAAALRCAREGHAEVTAVHLLSALLEEQEGLTAAVLDRSGARQRLASAVARNLGQRPRVEGGGSPRPDRSFAASLAEAEAQRTALNVQQKEDIIAATTVGDFAVLEAGDSWHTTTARGCGAVVRVPTAMVSCAHL